MQKRNVLLGVLVATCLLTACQTEKAEQSDKTTPTSTPTTQAETENENAIHMGGWSIEYVKSERGTELEDMSVILGYTGTGTEEFSKEAPDGKEFLLVKLIFEKEDGQEDIEWEKLTVTDGDGNEYKRIEDSFLTDLNMKRLSGTALNFGRNEGFIAFEVEEGASDFTLEYPFQDETLEIKF